MISEYVRHDLVDFVSKGVWGWSLRKIDTVFQREGLKRQYIEQKGAGQRRLRVLEYLASVDWESLEDESRILRVLECALKEMADDPSAAGRRRKWIARLREDGYELAGDGRLRPRMSDQLDRLRRGAPRGSSLQALIKRIQQTAPDDVEAMIGAAKEVVEATAKYALTVLQVPHPARSDIPALTKLVQERLLAADLAPELSDSGREAVRRLLGSLGQVPSRLAELRNACGSGHGRAEPVPGLRKWHGQLAIDAAVTWSLSVLSALVEVNGR